MIECGFVLRQTERGDILRAVEAIQRQLQALTAKPDLRALWVLGNNLTIIQTTLTNLPQIQR
jgi:hypothetical protein